jgi:CopG-like RHH_1 or ribbon-helix-helix domain, RHH_5
MAKFFPLHENKINSVTVAKLSKRINITLPDSVLNDLERWAQAQGRPTANLASFLIEIAIKQAKERGDFPTESQS